MKLAARKTIAVGSLLTLGGLAATVSGPSYSGQGDLRLAFLPLLLPLGLTVFGVIASKAWARWLALASAIALLPWALAIVAEDGFRIRQIEPWLVLGASVLLLITLTGRATYDDFEGRDPTERWAGRRMALIRWTVICNVAAVLNLWTFATAYTPAAAWHTLIPGLSAVGLVLGAGFLARQKTVGLLILAVCCVAFPPAASYFVSEQSTGAAEKLLFVFLFLPGWTTAVASLVSFAGPIRRFAQH